MDVRSVETVEVVRASFGLSGDEGDEKNGETKTAVKTVERLGTTTCALRRGARGAWEVARDGSERTCTAKRAADDGADESGGARRSLRRLGDGTWRRVRDASRNRVGPPTEPEPPTERDERVGFDQTHHLATRGRDRRRRRRRRRDHPRARRRERNNPPGTRRPGGPRVVVARARDSVRVERTNGHHASVRRRADGDVQR